ncbi:hypothetical protein K438DRAFT_1988852 [Mycena galopus ATCC 62051]|nr:hypothetical protein K438DRAFT_1988852 [Mycena galopus ATCC 62051]
MDGGGHAYVVTDLDLSSTTAALEAHVQDMASTTWTTSPISTVNRKAPEVYKRNVYYVEIAVRKGGIPAPGLTVKVTAPEYCQIDANGARPQALGPRGQALGLQGQARPGAGPERA